MHFHIGQKVTTTDISKLRGLLDWKLLTGTHEWPGPDGGTCILEAAIVAAGLPYRSVSSADDAPADFSPVVAEFLLQLNDGLPHTLRQQLIPFVTRLPGSAGSDQIEDKRLNLIITRIAKRILPSMLEASELPDCIGDLPPERSKALLTWAVEIVLWVEAHEAWPSEGPTLLDCVLDIVDEALKVGEQQVETIDVATAIARLEYARSLAVCLRAAIDDMARA